MKRNALLHVFFRSILPSYIRDNKNIMGFILRRIANHKVIDLLFEFHEKIPYLNNDEIQKYYIKLNEIIPQTTENTNVNTSCMQFILNYANSNQQMYKWLDCATGGSK